jgi:cellulose biosynthesis protein BcsQ
MAIRYKNKKNVQTPRTGTFIAVCNTKGGVGKTEICRHAAYMAIDNKQHIVLFDADSQNDSVNLMLPKGKNASDIDYTDFERTEFVLVTKNFADVQAYPDRIAIADCAPQADSITVLGSIADIWVIPVDADDRGVAQAILTAKALKKLGKPFVFVLSRWESSVSHAHDFIAALFEAGRIYRAILHYDAASVSSARVNRIPVRNLDEDLGELFDDLASWMLAGCPDDEDFFWTKQDLSTFLGIDDVHAVRAKERVRYENA